MKNKKYFKLPITFALMFGISFNVFAAYEDEKQWYAQSFISTDKPKIEYCNDTFVTLNGSIYTSSDGKEWNLTFSPAIGGDYSKINSVNGQLIVSGNRVQPIKSLDGKRWTPIKLYQNISPEDINSAQSAYFWNGSKDEIVYSKDLLVWKIIPLKNGERVVDMKFVNDRCFLSIKSNDNKFKFWTFDENLNLEQLDSVIDSIDNISYISKIESYVAISEDKSYIAISKYGDDWQKSDFSMPMVAENTDNVYSSNVDGRLFLNIDDNSYVTSDCKEWIKIDGCGDIRNLDYSGKYYYSLDNSNNLYMSVDGYKWNEYSIIDKKDSQIDIFQDKLVVNDVDFESGVYMSTVYIHNINSVDEIIPAIVSDNTLIDENIVGNLDSKDKKDKNQNNVDFNVDDPDLEGQPEELLNTIKIKIGDKKMTLQDGTEVELSVPTLIAKDNVLLPLRDVMEQIGVDMDWDVEEQKAILKYKSRMVTLWLNSDIIDIDGQKSTLAVPFKSVGGNAIVTIRPVIQGLGCEIEWINGNEGILIKY